MYGVSGQVDAGLSQAVESLIGSLQLPLGCFPAEGEAAGMRNGCSESEKGWSARSGLARIFCLQHVMLSSLSRLMDRLVWRLELVRCRWS